VTGPVSQETEAVLAELRKEGYELEGEAPVETKEEPAPEKAEEPEVPSQEEPQEPVDRAPREPALIPAWEHKVAEKRWEKEREQLQSQLEQLRAQPTQPTQEQARDLRSLAQQYGLALDESQERFFSALLQQAVPQDVTLKLEALERDRQVAYLESQYEQEFNKDVAPLLRERYGEVAEEKLAELKAKLHDTAFSETYAKVPLRKVFLAEEDTFKLQRMEPQTTVQAVKGGKTRAIHVDYDSVDEETFRRMSPEDVEKYTEHMIAKSGGRAWR
jgi:hypothetical protein